MPADRLPEPLPPHLSAKLVITVQSDGPMNFDRPVPVRFPNLEGLPPGEKMLLFSFNHDVGKWEVAGTTTISADGLFADSDPGTGIRQPGWHLVQVGTDTKGQPCIDGLCARFVGRHGDVITIDLNGTVAVSDLGFHNFQLSPLSGGTRFDLPGSRLFNELGYTFFAPTISASSTKPGQQGRATPVPSSPTSYSGTFGATLIRGAETAVREGHLRVDIYPDFSTTVSPKPSGSTDDINSVCRETRMSVLVLGLVRFCACEC